MTRRRIRGIALLVTVIGAAIGIGALVFRNNSVPPTVVRAPRGLIFHEAAEESGIDFRMAYLPNEQGVHFKVNLYDHGCGVAVGDYDGDGYEDVYFCNQLGRNALYRNKGDGTFEDVTEKAGVGLGDRVCVAATFADYDNDGHLDLFVTTTRGGNILFRNKGDGTFEDVTEKARLTCNPPRHSQTAVFFDYDNDGYLDLFITNTARWTLEDYDHESHYFPGASDFFQLAASPIEHNILYRNKGDGTFEDVTELVGLKGKGWSADAAVFDFNRDGYLDLLVTNMFGRSQLYRNEGGKKFTDVTREILGKTSWGAIGCKAFDFNNDGLLDLLIVDMHSDMWLRPSVNPRTLPRYDLEKKYSKALGLQHEKAPAWAKQTEDHLAESLGIRYDEVVFGNTLFKQLPNGKFVEVSDQANMETWWPWGIVTGDFDNDGFEDVYLPSGMGYPYFYWPSALMMNNGNGSFTNHAGQAGIEPPSRGEYHAAPIGGRKAARSPRSAAVADFDHDGRLDIVVNTFNDTPYYFRNRSPKKHYVAFQLTGAMTQRDPPGTKGKSTRDAIGALVTLHFGNDEVMVRQVHAAGGYLSQSSRRLHFGLGDRTRIDWAEIKWPSGHSERIDAPSIDKLHPITEK
jgi:hypothetical protein